MRNRTYGGVRGLAGRPVTLLNTCQFLTVRSGDSYDLNFANCRVRTRMPGGVAGVRTMMMATNADFSSQRVLEFVV